MPQQQILSRSSESTLASRDEVVAFTLKSAMRQLASGVSVITTSYEETWHGMTATSVTCLAMEPPSLLVCINRSAAIHAPLMAAGTLCVNLLSNSQEEMCRLFSSKSRRDERFKDGTWQMGPKKLPYHPSAQANIFCTIDEAHEYATHTVIFARVDEVKQQQSGQAGPMVYLDGRFVLV